MCLTQQSIEFCFLYVRKIRCVNYCYSPSSVCIESSSIVSGTSRPTSLIAVNNYCIYKKKLQSIHLMLYKR